jgi:hypothetical protein
MKYLPLNIDDFCELRRKNCVYVDKTGNIYNLITDSVNKYFLSRPRRFGKTLTISTIEQVYFCVSKFCYEVFTFSYC